MIRRASSYNDMLQHRTGSSKNAQQLSDDQQEMSSRLFVRKSAGVKSDVIRGHHGLTHEVRNKAGHIINEFDEFDNL